jgi:hypothetical protein
MLKIYLALESLRNKVDDAVSEEIDDILDQVFQVLTLEERTYLNGRE